MTGYTYEGRFFLVTLNVGVADAEDTDSYSVLAEDGEKAVEFAKEQARRDGYEYNALVGLQPLAEPGFLIGDPEKLFEKITE